ncbi:hypothetical protein IQ07DRAFT_649040 [Pyrenochaeta sp. DS3sAY3a]|nr:hypothetical protein IQ07DRAFT_649040 [Pyrenochaeta sp. DS3sAY3a]
MSSPMEPPTNHQHTRDHLTQGPPPVEKWVKDDDITYPGDDIAFLTKTPAYVILNQVTAKALYYSLEVVKVTYGNKSLDTKEFPHPSTLFPNPLLEFPHPLFKQWAWNFAPDGKLKRQASLSPDETTFWHDHMNREQTMLRMAKIYEIQRKRGEDVDFATATDLMKTIANPDAELAALNADPDRLVREFQALSQDYAENLAIYSAHLQRQELSSDKVWTQYAKFVGSSPANPTQSNEHNASDVRSLFALGIGGRAWSAGGHDFITMDRIPDFLAWCMVFSWVIRIVLLFRDSMQKHDYLSTSGFQCLRALDIVVDRATFIQDTRSCDVSNVFVGDWVCSRSRPKS